MSGPSVFASPRGRSEARHDEDRALFERLRRDGDPAAREALVRRFLPLAHKLAHGYRGGEDAEDLEQVAALGLLKAIDRFDPDRGLAFSTFAFPTILGELKRYFRDRSWSVRVPRSVQELALRLERVSVELNARLGRAPTVAELAAHTDATSEQVLEALQARTARRADSLDQPREEADGSDATGHDVAVEDPAFGRVEDGEMLDRLLSVLDPRDQRILELRFREDLVQSEIGAIVGVSQMQVSRSIRRSIALLQQSAQE